LRRGQYAVGLAYVRGGRPVLGVMGCPNLPYPRIAPAEAGGVDGSTGPRGCLMAAFEGAGATMEPLDAGADDADGAAAAAPVRIAVSDLADPSQATLCESWEAGHSDHGLAGRIAAGLRLSKPSQRLDSMCKYALLARGDATIYLRCVTAWLCV
jgi:3'(2'), 5'-bisphosphate nucleotidase